MPADAERKASFDALLRAAQSGDVRAVARLGLLLAAGSGAASDQARGLALIEQAARAGNREAAFLAATLASAGVGRARSWDSAFDWLLQAAQRGHNASQSALLILAGGPSGCEVPGTDWSQIRGSIDLAAWLSSPAARTIRDAPRIRIIEGFAPPAACDWLVARARERLSRATIYDKATGGVTVDGRRTNSQCDLDYETGGVISFLFRARIGVITGRPEQAMEVPKVLHYAPGETFAEHFDFLDPAEPAYAAELAQRGQRSETFLVYLNDDFCGGETSFPRLGLSHTGAKGDALLFANLDASGQPDRDTQHAGLAPSSGEKWLFSQWIRELPRA